MTRLREERKKERKKGRKEGPGAPDLSARDKEFTETHENILQH